VIAQGVYLLAAGHGRRAGGPKAWLEDRGRPLLARQLDFLVGLFPPPVIHVSVQASWLERCRQLSTQVSWVCVDPDHSPLMSLQELLRAAPPAGWFFVYHVDMSLHDGELFHRIASATTAGVEAVIPVHEDRGGHPVLLAPGLAPEILALDPRTGRLDHFLATRRTHRLQVDTDIIHRNQNERR
jgi:CTP:molybdopterin cytidylyltransferase MocA